MLVQGLGNVGGILIDQLRDAGAEVMFSEVDQATIQHFRDEKGLQFISGEEVYATECDVFVPCALGGVLNERTIPLLSCRSVVGGANNQLAHVEDAERLRARDILYAPDYVVNVGGAMGIHGIELSGWTPEEAEKRVMESVRRTLHRIFEMADDENITTDEASRRIAEEHML
jgi:leucine dehydrogenase